jgi:hypothetical protein
MRRALASALIVGVFAVLAVGSMDGSSSSTDRGPAKARSRAATPKKVRNTHFAHGTLNVRSGPGQNHRVLRKLNRGDTLTLGEPDAAGWARIMGRDSGYVFTRLGLVRTDAPVRVPDYAAAGPCAEEMAQVHQAMNRAPDAVKHFRESGVEELTWWYKERRGDTYPTFQFSFMHGPYTAECQTSRIENKDAAEAAPAEGRSTGRNRRRS